MPRLILRRHYAYSRICCLSSGSSALLKNGAGYAQIAAFVSSLMMVGVVTLPMEFKVFGKRAAILRNVLALGFSFLVALAMGVIFQ
jgi:uncharacterized membrane protein YraQ (UPF0718 family)